MIQSLLIKLAMLAMTMGVVFWIAWQAPQDSLKDPASDAPAAVLDVPVAPNTRQAGEENKSAASSTPALAQKAARSDVPVQSPHKGPLDLNRASAEEIDSLPGIGAVLAQRVIDYRKTSGGFRSVEDLRQVKGIGAKKLDRLRPLVVVSVPGTKQRTEKPPL